MRLKMRFLNFFKSKKIEKRICEEEAHSHDGLKNIVSSTNKMIKMQLMLTPMVDVAIQDIFEDIYFLGYFYGIHDAAFQFSGKRKPVHEMYFIYIYAIADFANMTHPEVSKKYADKLMGLMLKITENESNPIFQEAQLIAGKEYYYLMEGKTKSLSGLITHYLM